MKKLRKHQNAILLGFIITILLSWLVNPEARLLKENLDKVEGIIYDFRLKVTLPNTPRNNEHNIFIVDIH